MKAIKYLLCALLLLPVMVIAAVPSWVIVLEKSKISFTATQNNAPVKGEFEKFTGEIAYSPKQLDQSHVRIVIDMTSVKTEYPDLQSELKGPNWFDAKKFPQAIFEASEFTKTGDKAYEAKGNLTIRDKTLPVTVRFVEKEFSDQRAIMEGEVELKRTQFGVGQGDWTRTNEVKDEVKVDFVITATKKTE